MKNICSCLLILFPVFLFSQKSDSTKKKSSHKHIFGLKAGPNFSNITNASGINASSQTGFHGGLLIDLGSGIIGSRTELLYSRQGYDYASDSGKGTVKHDYVVLAQMLAINITRYVQIQFGMQMGYLLHAKADSGQSTGNATADNILKFYNRFDYAYGGGLEIHPFGGLLIGARYNVSLSNLYKQSFNISSNNGSSSYNSGINFKNNLVQIFIGYRF